MVEKKIASRQKTLQQSFASHSSDPYPSTGAYLSSYVKSIVPENGPGIGWGGLSREKAVTLEHMAPIFAAGKDTR